MMVKTWRITNKKVKGEAFSGQGAKEYGGRWNLPGTPAVYTAGSLALAILEALVHLSDYSDIDNYLAIPVEFDPALMTTWLEKDLPSNWRDNPIPFITQDFGQQWFKSATSAVLQLPSAVVPQEYNFILNPLHPDFPTIKIGSSVENPIDFRLIK